MTGNAPPRAIEHVAAYARARRDASRATLEQVLTLSNRSIAELDAVLDQLRARGQVALHFHPDRPTQDGHTVAESLLQSGRYANQFETGLSNGQLAAPTGGERHRWEQELFADAYPEDATSDALRPKYGALDLLHHEHGPAPRFGSCYLLLRPAVSARCTFTYPDSHTSPDARGTLAELDTVFAAVFAQSFSADLALGEPDMRPGDLLDLLAAGVTSPIAAGPRRPRGRSLDDYVEAQVHGSLHLSDDADRLVADPSFRDTETGETLALLCDRHGLELRWHGGLALRPDDVPSDFRGPAMPALAQRVAVDGWVDAAAIGRAARAPRQPSRVGRVRRPARGPAGAQIPVACARSLWPACGALTG